MLFMNNNLIAQHTNNFNSFNNTDEIRRLFCNYKPILKPKPNDISIPSFGKRKIDNSLYRWKNNGAEGSEESIDDSGDSINEESYSRALIIYQDPMKLINGAITTKQLESETPMELC